MSDNESSIYPPKRDEFITAKAELKNIVDIVKESLGAVDSLNRNHDGIDDLKYDCADLMSDYDKGYFSGIKFASNMEYDESHKSADEIFVARDGSSPLHKAAYDGNSYAVKLLIAYGADVNVVDSFKRTALHYACSCGHMEIVETLMEAGARMDMMDVTNETPYTYTIYNGDPTIAKYLKEKGAEFDENFICLHRVASKVQMDIIRFILADRDINIKDKRDRTLLHNAVERNELELVKFLVAEGAVIDTETNNYHQTPLLSAAKFGYLDIVKHLLEHHADINKADIFGSSPLIAAIVKKKKETALYLIRHGANALQTNHDGKNALHLACLDGELEIVQSIIEIFGANTDSNNIVNMKTIKTKTDTSVEGLTPLHIAAFYRHQKIVSYLLEHGADVDNKYWLGRSPLFEGVSSFGCTDVIKILVSYHASIHKTDIFGVSPLHMSCMGGNTSLVQYLLSQHADVLATDKLGYTPLHFAAYNGQADTVRILLENGANVHAKAHDGYTAMQLNNMYARNAITNQILSEYEKKTDVNVRHEDEPIISDSSDSVQYEDQFDQMFHDQLKIYHPIRKEYRVHIV